ncbi:uncharacterized protein Z518_04832 [Rhinocladiella mackenziei CBS 650.93]|uniref:Rhinocladiella mackenziei CBS 650.93 unplaced genomic scaffold supercont1.3, whole genome shotgun sequence n=1 Tax=Rhinocladiella mackenziei CBS 650.93 TaxID=1442369 RepID=A0A0D2IUM0_9EURO|nr:uncharacterized protein Z518_04832 [Rhinocladiella mackenziei CBS 650.93]KIX06856.1 hypothetical protein Z518_04832 [Rhinocladiella mackenziei CBS 650.93]
MSEVDLVVVGAGSSGLIATYTWLKFSPDSNVIIFESDTELGGAWSRNRVYPTLTTQTPVGMLEYSCFPMEQPEKTFYGLFSGEHSCEYLEAFALSMKFSGKSLKERVRFSSLVTKAQRREGMWEVHTVDGLQARCRKLIVATGATSIPHLPELLNQPQPVPVVHSRDLARNAEFLSSDEVQHVVVIGGSKSSFDAVYMLIQAGKSVSWIIRPGGHGPGLLAAPEGAGPFRNSNEILSLRLISKTSPCVFEPGDRWVRFFHRWRLGRWISNAIWSHVDSQWKGPAKYDRSQNMSKLKPDRSAFWGSDNVGVRNTVDLWDTVAKAKIYRDEVVRINEKSAVLSSGEMLDCDAVVACTGWDLSYPMFSKEDALALGLPMSVRDVPPENVEKWNSLAAESPVPVHCSQIQSLRAVAYLTNELKLPPVERRREEVASRIAWRRRRYLSDGHVIIFDQIPYQSMLVRDLGLKDSRKGGGWREILRPYYPKDYSGLMEEYLMSRSVKR